MNSFIQAPCSTFYKYLRRPQRTKWYRHHQPPPLKSRSQKRQIDCCAHTPSQSLPSVDFGALRKSGCGCPATSLLVHRQSMRSLSDILNDIEIISQGKNQKWRALTPPLNQLRHAELQAVRLRNSSRCRLKSFVAACLGLEKLQSMLLLIWVVF